MKKHGCIFFAAVFILGLLMVATNAQATEVEVPKIELSGLIQVGAGYQDIDYDNSDPDVENDSDLMLTTVELTAKAEVNEWVNVAAVFLYQDFSPFRVHEAHETDVEMDQAMVTIGNTQQYPLYCTAGKMYVPFGALLTHFPHAPHYPLFDGPVTMVFGETLEKALLVGFEHEGFSVSAYAFNGDEDKFGDDNQVESYGADANYSMETDEGLDILIGGSYINNITDADAWEETRVYVEELAKAELGLAAVPDWGLEDYVPGVAGYVHIGFEGFFLDGEYMSALDELELQVEGLGEYDTDIRAAVWNFEAGYNLDQGWWEAKNLEIVLEYAGSDDAEVLGLPESRYGICLNQDLYTDVILSLGYLRDNYDEDKLLDGRETRDLIFAQLAVEF